jgi:hypothetical protein
LVNEVENDGSPGWRLQFIGSGWDVVALKPIPKRKVICLARHSCQVLIKKEVGTVMHAARSIV